MSANSGTQVSAPIVPPDTADTHPTHIAEYGKGGFMSVATVSARDAIPAARKTVGMRVKVTSDATTSNNTDWEWDGSAWQLFVPVKFLGATAQGQLALSARRPRRIFAQLFNADNSVKTIKIVQTGDSLAQRKLSHMVVSLDKRLGGINGNSTNSAGSVIDGAGGQDLYIQTNTGCTVESGAFQYIPTGATLLMASGASADYNLGGVNAFFTDIDIYYVREPGAGTLVLKVGGTTVGSVSAANGSVALGKLTYSKAYGAATVNLSTTGGSVRILVPPHVRTGRSGVEIYRDMSAGGLSLTNAVSSAQGRALWQALLADINPHVITFEMDDDFGDGSTVDAAFLLYEGILAAACPLADKIIIASTPRATSDNLKLRSSNYLRGRCEAHGPDYLFFDSYYLFGSYADMVAIFGADDGTHPTAAAEGFAADALWSSLGIDSFLSGYASKAINDFALPSRLGRGSDFQHAGGGPDQNLKIDAEPSFSYDWDISFPRSLTFSTRGNYGTTNGPIIRVSGNTGVFSHVFPLRTDYDSSGNVRKKDTTTATGIEFTRYRKTDNPSGMMNLQFGFFMPGPHTKAEISALSAASFAGVYTHCSDCTGGAQLIFSNGTSWLTVDGKAAI